MHNEHMHARTQTHNNNTLYIPEPSGGAIFMGYGGTCVMSDPPSLHGHV